MTGYNSKRQMSQAKMNDDDDTQIYADTLLIVYQRGFSDGKAAAEQRKPLTDEEIDALANNNGTVDLVTWWRQLARAIEAAHNIKEQP